MRNPKLKYAGLLVAIVGGLMTVTGLYLGSMPYFESEISDYSMQIILGIIMLAAGLFTWIVVFE